ncbi:MAG: hypothetical protein E7L17_14630 [Clostridium sp.]|uniref:hypothetical protein n=1 Tax=Clostridium sp. TaxID=1506 RepID=UPI002914B028|nr:hypothetical protein [Clostridium sp.]MDU7339336.1 hypothetical protein [Clostridium sp.]
MPEMTPLEAARLLEMDARDCMYISKIKINVAKRLAASYLRKIANGEYKQVVHARWITNSDYPDTVICSACGYREDVWWADNGTSHCPYCGAVMGKDDNYD